MRKVVLIKGDGIGPEISDAVLEILKAADAQIEWIPAIAGLQAADQIDDPLPEETIQLIKEVGTALKGPLTTPVATGGENAKNFRSINVRMRKELDLYANVRPVKNLPGLPSKFENVDLVIIRENTEGLYSGSEVEITPGVVASLKVATRHACSRIAQFAFSYAERQQRKKVTAVHKANIMKVSDGLALECYREVASQYPAIEYEERIVDATAMGMVVYPERFDVMVMENLYGDILSDLAAGLIGGLGLAGSANIGDRASLFEAVHGSAPDIAGKGIANPTALLLSAIEMLRHLGQMPIANKVAAALEATTASGKSLTADLGGNASTEEFTKAVIANL